MTMDRSPCVAMRVDMPGDRSRFTASRCVEWIILRGRSMVVPMPMIAAMLLMTMVVLGELGLITTRLITLLDNNRHRKLVRLWNLLDRFPIRSTTDKSE